MPARGRERVAIIGSVGIPNRYGGPEAFAESIAPVLVERGFDVTVTCDRSRYLDDLSATFNGVRRCFVPVRANGASSPVHDLVAFLLVAWRAHYVLALGVSGGLFFPLMRFICLLTRTRLLVNVDGVEWRRGKFGPFGKLVLYCSDLLAQRFAHVVIYDNEALIDYVRYPWKSTCVEYSGDQARMPRVQVDRKDMALTICRIEPENNCDVLIEGFLRSQLPMYVFVGNWDRSEYGRELRRKYADIPRLRLLDPIYDAGELFRLRASCSVYLHGHSVGGTNPSLVEILFFDCRVLCWDCAFNRATAADTAEYFSSADVLGALLMSNSSSVPDRSSIRRRYSRDAIVGKLIEALNRADLRRPETI